MPNLLSGWGRLTVCDELQSCGVLKPKSKTDYKPYFRLQQNRNIINLQLHETLENGTENEVVGFVLENCLV